MSWGNYWKIVLTPLKHLLSVTLKKKTQISVIVQIVPLIFSVSIKSQRRALRVTTHCRMSGNFTVFKAQLGKSGFSYCVRQNLHLVLKSTLMQKKKKTTNRCAAFLLVIEHPKVWSLAQWFLTAAPWTSHLVIIPEKPGVKPLLSPQSPELISRSPAGKTSRSDARTFGSPKTATTRPLLVGSLYCSQLLCCTATIFFYLSAELHKIYGEYQSEKVAVIEAPLWKRWVTGECSSCCCWTLHLTSNK